MNEELSLAMDILRQRLPNDAWFIPVLFQGDIPDWKIVADKMLRDLQWVELNYEDWGDDIQRIFSALQPEKSEAIESHVDQVQDEDEEIKKNLASAITRSGPGVGPNLIEYQLQMRKDPRSVYLGQPGDIDWQNIDCRKDGHHDYEDIF